MSPEIERVSGSVAAETTKDVLADVYRKTAVAVSFRRALLERFSPVRVGEGAWSTPLLRLTLRRLIVDKIQDLENRDACADRYVVETAHDFLRADAFLGDAAGTVFA